MYKLSEFCAGTGGFSLGFHNTGEVETVFANDFDVNSKLIFDANFDIKLNLSNIHDIDIKNIPKMDILTSGFPCQPFSIAGQRKGFNDTRSNVFWKLIDIIKFHQPICIVFENVKNLCTHDEGRTFNVIKQSITDIGYTFKYKIINTCKFTKIPQNRERIYIVCFKDNFHTNIFEFPDNDDEIYEIKDMLQSSVDDKYYYSDKLKVWSTINGEITSNINTNTVYQYRRHYVRQNKNNVCPTLTANMGSGGHNVPLIKDNNGIRKLTPRECFNLQGFNDGYVIDIGISDSALYKLAGNAVTVEVVNRISHIIINVLNEKNEKLML